ncbi:MAG: hypothetical protein ABEJ07_04325 [Candidatus Nanohaloarchaea archaeon]
MGNCKGLQAIEDKLEHPSFHASRRGRAGENLSIAYIFLLVVGEPREHYLIPSSKVIEEVYETGNFHVKNKVAEEFRGLSYLEEIA